MDDLPTLLPDHLIPLNDPEDEEDSGLVKHKHKHDVKEKYVENHSLAMAASASSSRSSRSSRHPEDIHSLLSASVQMMQESAAAAAKTKFAATNKKKNKASSKTLIKGKWIRDRNIKFPVKLYAILQRAGEVGFENVIAWDKEGRSFVVHDKLQLIHILNRQGWKLKGWDSLQRQFNHYGFKRSKNVDANNKVAFHIYHPSFLRDQPELLQNIKNTRKPYSQRSAEKNKDRDYGASEATLQDFGYLVGSDGTVVAESSQKVSIKTSAPGGKAMSLKAMFTKRDTPKKKSQTRRESMSAWARKNRRPPTRSSLRIAKMNSRATAASDYQEVDDEKSVQNVHEEKCVPDDNRSTALKDHNEVVAEEKSVPDDLKSIDNLLRKLDSKPYSTALKENEYKEAAVFLTSATAVTHENAKYDATTYNTLLEKSGDKKKAGHKKSKRDEGADTVKRVNKGADTVKATSSKEAPVVDTSATGAQGINSHDLNSNLLAWGFQSGLRTLSGQGYPPFFPTWPSEASGNLLQQFMPSPMPVDHTAAAMGTSPMEMQTLEDVPPMEEHDPVGQLPLFSLVTPTREAGNTTRRASLTKLPTAGIMPLTRSLRVAAPSTTPTGIAELPPLTIDFVRRCLGEVVGDDDEDDFLATDVLNYAGKKQPDMMEYTPLPPFSYRPFVHSPRTEQRDQTSTPSDYSINTMDSCDVAATLSDDHDDACSVLSFHSDLKDYGTTLEFADESNDMMSEMDVTASVADDNEYLGSLVDVTAFGIGCDDWIVDEHDRQAYLEHGCTSRLVGLDYQTMDDDVSIHHEF